MEPTLSQTLIELGEKAKNASKELALLGNVEKNKILASIQNGLLENIEEILKANEKDMEYAREKRISESLLDRLKLTEERIRDMISAIDVLIQSKDPVGKMEKMETLDNGLRIGKRTVPIGVLAMIYESRPNVTCDGATLAIKSGNAILLRGGKEAIHSNKALVKSIKEGIEKAGHNSDMVGLIEDTTRESSYGLMGLRGYVDLLIPRGSKGLIQSVVENAKVPTLETGAGNCHVYVDSYGNVEMALKIIENAKTSRTGVCNAMESLLIHKDVKDEFYQGLEALIQKHGIKTHGDERVREKMQGILPATEEDYFTEYLDLEMSVAVVDSLEEAIAHIDKYSTGHSEVIVTENYENAMMFLDRVDSSCVYVNASSRFTDGGEFGKGAEIGISTQKLHARGPVGLEELTSSKYIVFGNGQIR